MKNKVIAATLALSTLAIVTFANACSSNALQSGPQESSVAQAGHGDSFSGSYSRRDSDSLQGAEYIQLIAILALSG
ncbi:MAG: hypothetical protein HC907_38830, partial [Richelia sp. SM1_7_0]|nr:hypothetical protein [Richelia sp. SM1_7_0]